MICSTNKFLLFTTVGAIAMASSYSCFAQSSQLKPVLKAIDPSQAKYDTLPPPPQPPSPNPLGHINGAPIDSGAQSYGQASTFNQTPPSAPPGFTPQYQPGYPQQTPMPAPSGQAGNYYPSYQQQYPSQNAAVPNAQYSPQYPAQYQMQYAPQYPSQNPTQYPQQYGSPYQSMPQGAPQANGPQQYAPGYMPQQMPVNPSQYVNPYGAQAAPQANMAPSMNGLNQMPGYNQGPATPDFPAESQIPQFGQPLPTSAPPSPASYPPTAMQMAAPSFALSMPPQYPLSDDQRVMRLEQLAFGSTYPEHDLADRVNHLDREIFGQVSTGTIADRVAKLEASLVGGGSAQAPRTTQAAQAGPAVQAAQIRQLNQSSAKSQSSGQSFPPPLPPPANSLAFPQATSAPGAAGSDLVIKAIPYNGHAGDYFASVRKYANGAIARWQSFPITIHLPADSPESWLTSLQQDVKKWGQFIPLKVVALDEPANIDVFWINHLPPGKLGVARLKITQGKMEVMVLMLRPTYYLPAVPEKVLQGAFLHELGHGIGIFGHSESKGDIMEDPYLMPSKVSEPAKFGAITPRDLNTLKHIYEAPLLPANFSLPQPLDMSFTLIGH